MTSVSDTDRYRAACERAITPSGFKNFKRDPDYNEILEHVGESDGWKYASPITDMPLLMEHLDRFRENDGIGNPRTYFYGDLGMFSPTTLRYIYVLGDMIKRFGSLDGMDIIEIGGGYGGQAKIIHALYSPKSYTMVDLPGALALQKKYLAGLPVTFDGTGALTKHSSLVISNYAFSECDKPVQRIYAACVLTYADRGYITCNFEGAAGRLTWQEMEKFITGSKRSTHLPPMGDGLFLWTWGEK